MSADVVLAREESRSGRSPFREPNLVWNTPGHRLEAEEYGGNRGVDLGQ